MYSETLNSVAVVAKKKANYLKSSLASFLISSALAGVYVGFGIVLIFCIGAPIASAESIFLKMILGVSFGIALTLVVFAGSELFTGNNMFMTVGVIRKTVTIKDLANVWIASWIGNLIGAVLFGYLVVKSGTVVHAEGLLDKVSAAKMNMPAMQLFLKGILCNWLVCLALWTSGRTKNDAAKCILIFWCLFAFISCGYEHSIANMTLLSLSLFSQHSETVSWLGFVRNLFYVTGGNIIGGSFFVAILYCFASSKIKQESVS